MRGKLIDLTGQKFGKLIVIKRVNNDKWGNLRWLCKCECGIEKVIVGNSLRYGGTKSCGCLGKKLAGDRRRLKPGLAAMRQSINNYKKRAKRRGLKWDLTEEQFKEITQKNCCYCGAEPNNTHRGMGMNGNYVYNGIDRVNNKKGYLIDNIVPCCKTCNRAKDILTLQEFKDWIKRTYSILFIL